MTATNPSADYREVYTPTTEQLDQIYARTREKQLAEIEQKRRVLEWPGEVNAAIVAMGERIAVLEAQVAALQVEG